jgi:hypothetical protein
MYRVFLEVPKNSSKGLLWTPHLQHMWKSRPGSPGSTLEKTSCGGFFIPLFCLCWAQVSRLYIVLVVNREMQLRKISGLELLSLQGSKGTLCLPVLLWVSSEGEADDCPVLRHLPVSASELGAVGKTGRREAIWLSWVGQTAALPGFIFKLKAWVSSCPQCVDLGVAR